MPEKERGSHAGVTLQATDIRARLAASGGDAADILRAVALTSPQPMVLTDANARDSPMIFCKRAFTQLTGFREEEVIGCNMRFLQGKLTDEAARTVLRDAIAARRESQAELWNYRKDSSAFWCSMFVGPMFDQQGRLVYWFGSQLDATARREAEEARAQARRMDTLGSMAAGVAHEFDDLMTVVIGNVEATRGDALTLRQAERLARIESAARSAGRLTKQMLSFAGRSSLQAETIDLNTVVADFDRILAQVTASDRRFELRLSSAALPARVDVGQLELCLINLVRNASDASKPGGRIIVATAGYPSQAVERLRSPPSTKVAGCRPRWPQRRQSRSSPPRSTARARA